MVGTSDHKLPPGEEAEELLAPGSFKMSTRFVKSIPCTASSSYEPPLISLFQTGLEMLFSKTCLSKTPACTRCKRDKGSSKSKTLSANSGIFQKACSATDCSKVILLQLKLPPTTPLGAGQLLMAVAGQPCSSFIFHFLRRVQFSKKLDEHMLAVSTSCVTFA